MNPTIEQLRADAEYVAAELRSIDTAAAGRDLTDDEQARFDEGVAFVERQKALIERHNRVAELA